MLRFQNPPDEIFTVILEQSLRLAIRDVKAVVEAGDPRGYKWVLPFSHGVFPPALALATLKRLLDGHRSPVLFGLNDYHFLLLYDVLYVFTSLHNKRIKARRGKNRDRAAFRVGPFKILEIDFDALVDLFFWDTDFLMASDDLIELGLEWRRQMGISSEAFSISLGLQPHAEELELKMYDEEPPRVDRAVYFSPSSRKYPEPE